MKIQYQKIENGLEILRIWQDSGIIKVPEQIEGIHVIRIAPYTFSLHKDEEEKNASVYQTEIDEEDDRFAQPEELCCGGMVREIHLPSTVQSIGNYAFYGCMNLKLFHGTDAIVRMGSGVFTGCRLEKVEIDFMDGNKSCLKEILTEIRYQIIATLRYQGTETKILFPEYYADAVENTTGCLHFLKQEIRKRQFSEWLCRVCDIRGSWKMRQSCAMKIMQRRIWKKLEKAVSMR